MARTWLPRSNVCLMLLHLLEQLIFPPSSVCHICPPSSCLLTHREGRKWLRSPPSCWMQTAMVHVTALMRSFEHQLRLNMVGGWRWGRIRISTHICVGVFTAEEEERLHSFSRAAETSGWKVEAMEEDREERLFSQEAQPQCSSFRASDFFIKYQRNAHLRCGTFAPDWKVCKHRSGVNPLHVDLFGFYAPSDE